MTAPAIFPELAPPPPPARPRVLMVGTAFASVAAAMAFAGMLGLYLARRDDVLAAGATWLPEGVEIPLLHGTMNAATFAMSVVTITWAVWSIGQDDRIRTFLAFGVTLLLGVATIVRTGFYYTQIHAGVRSEFGVLFYGITGAHLAMTAAGLAFMLLMVFRTLGGQYSARDREGVAAAALFWYVTAAVYAVIWYAIFITK
ncbi:MAG: cytochrome c oxidase subunit 3 [Acidimicrobiales bacterium]